MNKDKGGSGMGVHGLFMIYYHNMMVGGYIKLMNDAFGDWTAATN
jgi:hypothetical protein